MIKSESDHPMTFWAFFAKAFVVVVFIAAMFKFLGEVSQSVQTYQKNSTSKVK